MANPWDSIRKRMAGALGWSANGTRDLYDVMGYPRVITSYMYRDMYLRNGIASRVVRAYPAATWRQQPTIRDEAGDSDEKNSKQYSPFVDSVNQLFAKFGVMRYMERTDRLSGIGTYGALFMGFQDGEVSLDRPLRSGRVPLLYLAPYGQPNLQVSRWVTDQQNPRFGQPDLYTMMTGTERQLSQVRRSISADASRVIHVAEGLDQDEVYGAPVLEAVYNWMLDLEKVVGSSAETYWLNARGGMSISADKDARLLPDALVKMREQAEDFTNQLTRIIASQGMTAQMLQANTPSPQFHVEKLMDLIAGAKAIPKRILMGSERSDLSSTQDEQNFSTKVEERQVGYAGPSMLKPFVQKMIDTGNVESPQGMWWIEWPDSGALGPAAQADIGLKNAQALAAYSNSPGAELIVPKQEFRATWLNLPSEPDQGMLDPEPVDLDETDPAVQEQFAISGGGTGAQPVQDKALSGIQITALTAIVEAVVSDTMPLESAVALILLSFPGVDEATARAMLQPAVDFEAPAPEPLALPSPSTDGSVPESASTSAGPQDDAAGAVAKLAHRAAATVSRKLRLNVAPRTLYVMRQILNAEDIRAHYRDQGLDVAVPADDMHVTIAYSTTAIDWTKIPDDWTGGNGRDGGLRIGPGGMRMHDQFGTDGAALVLLFTSSDLSWRWGSIREAGASWSWGDYTPHVTISYEQGSPETVALVPWTGAIELGPEQWDTVNEDWKDDVVDNVWRTAP